MLRTPPLVLCLALAPGPVLAQAPPQIQDAELPRRGHLWLEVFPSLENWSDRFLRSGSEAADGGRRPLSADFDGPILQRAFPSIAEELLADLNSDAEALGYDPMGPGDLSVGGLAFGTVNKQVRRFFFSLRYGILDRLSLEVGAPLVFTEVEPLFAFDTLSATVARASAALPQAESVLADLEAVRSSLQALVDGGSLDPEEEEEARALLASAGSFLDALQMRVVGGRFLPLGSSTAGAQMAARFAALGEGFASFGLALPALGLQEVAPSAELASLFTGDPFSAALPGVTERSFTVGEVEAGIRLGLLDSFADTTAQLRLRTAVGARVRLPIRQADRPPFHDPDDFFELPIGDGQPDLELAAYQDLLVGRRLHLNAIARLGIQMADEVTLRVHPPDRPFALPGTRSLVRRDLGDYLQLRVAPQLMLNPALSIGAEYDLWRKGSDTFRILQAGPDAQDAAPLELDTAETRHRLGLGAFLRPGGLGRDGAGRPWLIAFTFRSAVAGSGGRTPASQLVTAAFRFAF